MEYKTKYFFSMPCYICSVISFTTWCVCVQYMNIKASEVLCKITIYFLQQVFYFYFSYSILCEIFYQIILDIVLWLQALLCRIASTHSGSELLLEQGTFSCLSSMAVFDRHPDIVRSK